VNAGEETVVELAIGTSRVIKAVVDVTGEVTKVTVETAANVATAVGGGIVRAISNKDQPEKDNEIDIEE